MRVPVLKLPFDEEDIRAIADGVAQVIRSGMLMMGPNARAFEDRFAAFCGTPHAVGTSSGSSALEILFRLIGVDGGTVLLPANTFMATASAAIKAGGRVIFCDLESDTLQIDPDEIEAKIQADTRAVVVVHVGGIITPHWDRIQEICAKHRVVLIEDAAHAHGASFHGRMAGALGLAGAFSFFPTKVLTTAEGGMITTSDADLAAEARILRDHGKQSGGSSPHVRIGDNWRPSELHAVLGLRQMQKADWILGERRRLAGLYDRWLPGLPGLKPLRIPNGVQSSFYKYIVFLDPDVNRDVLKKRMREEFDVALTGEVYADPCHLQPVFERHPEFLGRPLEPLPRTESAAFHHACLPLYPGLTDDDIYYVVESLKKALE